MAHLELQFKAPAEFAWSVYSIALVIEREGYGAAHRKLSATRERYANLGVLDPDAEWRIVGPFSDESRDP